MSLQDTINNMHRIKQDSQELQRRMISSASILSSQAQNIWETTRGSQSGNSASLRIRKASDSLIKSTQSLKMLNNEIDKYIAAAQK